MLDKCSTIELYSQPHFYILTENTKKERKEHLEPKYLVNESCLISFSYGYYADDSQNSV